MLEIFVAPCSSIMKARLLASLGLSVLENCAFAGMIFRKEPFFYGHDNYDQLVKIAKVSTLQRLLHAGHQSATVGAHIKRIVLLSTMKVQPMMCLRVHIAVENCMSA